MVGEAYGWANSHRSHWVGLYTMLEYTNYQLFHPRRTSLGTDRGP